MLRVDPKDRPSAAEIIESIQNISGNKKIFRDQEEGIPEFKFRSNVTV